MIAIKYADQYKILSEYERHNHGLHMNAYNLKDVTDCNCNYKLKLTLL